ncbi:MAG: hypothetical protein ABH879_02550 [archaeon]
MNGKPALENFLLGSYRGEVAFMPDQGTDGLVMLTHELRLGAVHFRTISARAVGVPVEQLKAAGAGEGSWVQYDIYSGNGGPRVSLASEPEPAAVAYGGIARDMD